MQLCYRKPQILNFRLLKDRFGGLLVDLEFKADESVGAGDDEGRVEDGEDDCLVRPWGQLEIGG